MRILIHNMLCLGLLILLSACGQKGDLYLPQEAATPTSPPPAVETSTTLPKETD